ncbi:unnamed protein product [Hydatigera taeniaeformis]|uniref:tRNA-synt_2 domain-containing protein n=1 Tax=Hydatigena taeniaeformis TaxID=6205 RepID=A0A0R3WVF8_HYDTA|nr:unnamed protein product [Hydatigera taeniaeformis]
MGDVDTPILTTTDCEGAGETFLVKSKSKGEEEGGPAPLHLTVSAQLHLEALALGMSKHLRDVLHDVVDKMAFNFDAKLEEKQNVWSLVTKVAFQLV